MAKRRGGRGWELEGGYHCYIIAHGRSSTAGTGCSPPDSSRRQDRGRDLEERARALSAPDWGGRRAAPSASEAPTEPLQSHGAEEEAVPRPYSSKGGRKEAPGPESSTAGCSPA